MAVLRGANDSTVCYFGGASTMYPELGCYKRPVAVTGKKWYSNNNSPLNIGQTMVEISRILLHPLHSYRFPLSPSFIPPLPSSPLLLFSFPMTCLWHRC